ncbi:predicted protein, partial [Nematostella vectensis]
MEAVDEQKNDECIAKSGTFDLLEVGCTGKVEVVPHVEEQDEERDKLKHLTTLPSGLPPLFPEDLKTELEQYLTSPEKLPIHDFHHTQRFWPRTRDTSSLFLAEVCPVQTALKVERNPTTGELLGYNEVPVAGGMDSENHKQPKIVFDGEVDFEKDLLDTPPGFSYSVRFCEEEKKEETHEPPEVLNMAEILAGTDLEDLEFSEDEDQGTSDENSHTDEEADREEDSAILKKSDSLEKILKK